MYNLYNKTAAQCDEEYQALAAVKKAAFDEGYKQGIERGLKDNANNEKHYAIGYKAGREHGFSAGYAAAQGQPAAKIEEAYQQGVAAASKLVLLRKNGVGY